MYRSPCLSTPSPMNVAVYRGPRQVEIVPRPRRSLEGLPDGSLMVKALYVSICGSDTGLFRRMPAWKEKAAGLYGGADGFCGHEIVGVVVELGPLSSSSDWPLPQVGDFVLCLPPAYFCAHASTRPDWYRPTCHDALADSRWDRQGGFATFVPTHVNACCVLPRLSPSELEMRGAREDEALFQHGVDATLILAQPWATMLRAVDRCGVDVSQHSHCVLGCGQNGLLLILLLRRLGATTIVAVDPLPWRRAAAERLGASCAVDPTACPAAEPLAGGDGAPVCATDPDALRAHIETVAGAEPHIVWEMVGHNQTTINYALKLAQHGGRVVAFGVNDDATYDNFAFGVLFRRNLTLIGTAYPDLLVHLPKAVHQLQAPDFPLALLRREILTHHFLFSELQQALEHAADYKDKVVKVCVHMSE